MVSVATHNTLLKNGDFHTKVLIFQQQLIQTFKLGTNSMLRHRTFIQCSDFQNYQICIFTNINENIRNKRTIVKKLRGVQVNLSTFQLLTILYYQPQYQFNANT